jgi:hypothetical protein
MAETEKVAPDFALKYQNINDFYKFVEATEKDDGSKALKFLCQMCLPIKSYYKTDTKAPMSNLRYYIYVVDFIITSFSLLPYKSLKC